MIKDENKTIEMKITQTKHKKLSQDLVHRSTLSFLLNVDRIRVEVKLSLIKFLLKTHLIITFPLPASFLLL